MDPQLLIHLSANITRTKDVVRPINIRLPPSEHHIDLPLYDLGITFNSIPKISFRGQGGINCELVGNESPDVGNPSQFLRITRTELQTDQQLATGVLHLECPETRTTAVLPAWVWLNESDDKDQNINNCRDIELDSARNQRQDAAATTDIDAPTLKADH